MSYILYIYIYIYTIFRLTPIVTKTKAMTDPKKTETKTRTCQVDEYFFL